MAKAAKKTEPAPEESILDTLAKRSPAAEPAKAAPEVDVGALMAQIASLQGNFDRLERTNAALMSQPPSQPQYQTPQVPQHQAAPQFGAMPDPVMDPEGFNKALADRITGTIGAAMQAQNQISAQQASQDAQADRLWAQFEQKYPDLAPHKKFVGISAAELAEEMKMKGIDMNRYMRVASDQFLDDVAVRVKKDFGAVVAKEDEPELVPARAVLGRTAGISGGHDGVAGSGAKTAEAELGSMTKDLTDLQVKEGYF